MKPTLSATILTLLLAGSSLARAGLIASDQADNYSGGSWSGNKGTGFGAWTFVNTPNGGSAGEYLAANNGGSAVNSGPNGNAWGMYANSSANNDAQANAIRPFSEGSLLAGQTLGVQMNNGDIATRASVGFSLRDSSHNNIFEFYFHGGDPDYTINVSGTPVTTSVGWTTGALTLAFTQGSGDSWSFSINGTTTYTSSGTGYNLSANDISEIRFFSSGNNKDIFFNYLQITAVPEPINLALSCFGGLFAAAGLARFLKTRFGFIRIRLA